MLMDNTLFSGKDVMLTTMQAAALLGVSTARIRQLATANRLAGRKVGRDWWISLNALEAHKAEKAALEARRGGERVSNGK